MIALDSVKVGERLNSLFQKLRVKKLKSGWERVKNKVKGEERKNEKERQKGRRGGVENNKNVIKYLISTFGLQTDLSIPILILNTFLS